MRLLFDRQLHAWKRSQKTTLLGGSPTRVLKLSASGSRVVQSWMRGDEVAKKTSHRELARRLIAAGVAHPDPEPSDQNERPAIHVIIPVKDDPKGLQTTLSALAQDADHTRHRTIVVDDASLIPIGSVYSVTDVEVTRHHRNTGPAGARNTGATLVAASEGGANILAFVDAGVTVSVTDLLRLSLQFVDPEVVAVAPRVRSADGSGLIDRFESLRSPLDQGPQPGRVMAGSTISYVPSAVLLVRRSTFAQLGGFDDGLRFGEDVDLVWRLSDLGSVRYDPSVTAWHPPRPNLRDFVSQRVGYGSSAAPLAKRHGARMTHFRSDGYGAAISLLAVCGRPGRLAAAALLLWRSQQAARALGHAVPDIPDAKAHGFLLASKGLMSVVTSAARAAGRPWWPITAGLLLTPLRRQALIAAIAGWFGHTQLKDPPLIGVAILDDLAYGFGVWAGMLRTKSARSILPDIQFRPDVVAGGATDELSRR